MKNIILLALAALMMVGCMKTKDNGEPIISDYYNQHSVDNPYIQVLDSCEYICWNRRMAHKGNCRFCKERRQKELEELVIKLKEIIMGFHQKCKIAKQCPHESETTPGTCGYHHCRLSKEEINELTIGCKYTQKELEDRYYEQVKPKVNPFIGGLIGEFVTDAND